MKRTQQQQADDSDHPQAAIRLQAGTQPCPCLNAGRKLLQGAQVGGVCHLAPQPPALPHWGREGGEQGGLIG